MSGSEITIKSVEGEDFMAYLAMPAGGSGPGIVVIQEIFGVNPVMRQWADWLAGEGYVALCPDLFWRIEPGVQLTDGIPEQRARAFEFLAAFDLGKGVQDVDCTIETLRGIEGCSGKIGTVGFCLGGRLAYLSTTRNNVDAAVGYYGVHLTDHLDETITAPLMLQVAELDDYMPPEAQRQLHGALDGNPLVTIHDYVGKGHAFARIGGEHYDKDAAQLANDRTLAFFKEHLS